MSAKNVLKVIKDKDIDYVDLRFTDPRGKLQHVTMDAKMVDEDMLNDGIFLMVPQLLVGKLLMNLT